MGVHDCCARSQRETVDTLKDEATFGTAPRECAIRAKMPGPFPWVPPLLRGHGQCQSCVDSVEYRKSLHCDDYVIKHPPTSTIGVASQTMLGPFF
eukprot:9340105-Pyramimonas_sp.AAC.1